MIRIDITGLDDPALRDYTQLTDVKLRSAREPAEGLFLAESAKVIDRALRAGFRPRSLLLLEQWLPEIEPLLAGFPEVPVYVGSSAQLEEITGFHMHRGALASMHRGTERDAAALLAASRRVVVLEDITDHTNVGAIFRSVAGLGADAVLLSPRCADPLYRRSVRVSMGAVLQIPWARLPEWDEAKPLFTEAGFTLAALALSDTSVELAEFAAHRPERVALMLGSEGPGLTRAALARADEIVTIPMDRGVDSLNVATAAALALWALRDVPRAPAARG